MKDTTLISVVTPIYNGAQFVKSAYECLCRQTYRYWQWVVVDDGSTDDTRQLMRELTNQDRRVHYTWQPSSGTAKLPRDRAVFQAFGDYVLPFDIDDSLEPDYLRKMLERMQETQADIVYPHMFFINKDTNEVTQILPVADFDDQKVYEGRELVRHTMPEWRIGCNGGLYRYKSWINVGFPWPVENSSDEVDERIYQINASRVAFSTAKYFYQNHSDSYTQKIAPKFFIYRLTTNLELADVIEKNFEPDSEEVSLLHLRLLYGWRSLAAIYVRKHDELIGANDVIESLLKRTFLRIDPTKLPLGVRLKFLNISHYQLVFSLFCLKHSPRFLFEKLLQRRFPDYYQQSVLRKHTDDMIRSQVSALYTSGQPLKQISPFVVCIFRNTLGGGLIDRLRGAVSTFTVCRELNIPFKLSFTEPFPLTDYLEPNAYDWRCEDDEISFAAEQSHPVVTYVQSDTPKERELLRSSLYNELKEHQHQQCHVFTNASFCYDADFQKEFDTLFKPSERLRLHIEKIQQELGNKPYISISMRFCHLLGDFNEEVYSQTLTKKEQESLIRACMDNIERIHLRHPQKRIVVCSDSVTMLEEAQKKDYVYVIPGKVSHIGNDSSHSYYYYEKTFLDFFIISQAEQVFLLKGSGMHNSGFPYAAARVGNRPYQVVEF